MAIFYVNDGASGAGNGSSKADAAVSLASGIGVAADDEIWLAHTHVETIAGNVNLDFSNAQKNHPVILKSMNFTTDVVQSGAHVTAGSNLEVEGELRLFGIHFNGNNNLELGNNDDDQYYEGCNLKSGNHSYYGNNRTNIIVKNSNIVYGNTFATQGTANRIHVINSTCTDSAGAALVSNPAYGSIWKFHGCNLSAITQITEGATNQCSFIELNNCSLGSGWSIGTVSSLSTTVAVKNSAFGNLSVATNQFKMRTGAGTITSDNTRYRASGASDGFQANPYSLLMETNNVAAEIYVPLSLEYFQLGRRVSASTSPTGATAKEIYTTYRCAPNTTPSGLATDSSSWTGSNLDAKYKFDHTLSSQNGATLTVYLAGPSGLNNDDVWIDVMEPDQVGGQVKVNVFFAKPSGQISVDPKLEIA